MFIETVASVSQTLPLPVVERLSGLLHEMGRSVAEDVLVLTEISLPVEVSWRRSSEKFVLVASERFSALFLAAPPQATNGHDAAPSQQTHYDVRLWFDPGAIAAFGQELMTVLPLDSPLLSRLQQVMPGLQPNHADLQSAFTLKLVAALTGSDTAADASVNAQSCAPFVTNALQQQADQERSLNEVMTQIRRSMDLPIILQTAVQQVRQRLHVDRVVIHEFKPLLDVNGMLPISETDERGRITYESRAAGNVPSILAWTEGADCFDTTPDVHSRYLRGFTLAIDDVDLAFAHAPCLVQMLRKAGVRSKLVVPIVVQDDLWGLLIAHQCTSVRHWQETERSFLVRIAEYLAIAIHQASLYAQLQQQKQTLEKQMDKRTQDLYDALTAAQSANLTKSEFLATVSHELRTPLTCIIGMAETLRRLPPGAEAERILPQERRREYLKTIQNCGEHLLQLINDILDLSQLEAGKLVLEVQEFSLSQTVRESLNMLRDEANRREISLEMDIQLQPQTGKLAISDVDLFWADPRRIKQILLNLLSNAVKFTPEGGRVILSVWREQEEAVFQVRDTGIGIPETQKARLFEKFQQLDMSRQRRYEGTGLGLALTKQLVELHRGWIEVESKVDVGSSFTVWIPPQTILRDTPSRDLIQPIATQGRLVLIEESDEIATLLCNLLTTAGYQVVWMVHGPALVEQVKLLQPLTVLIGTHLTGIQPGEVVQDLRQQPLLATVPILVYAAEATEDLTAEWGEMGANGYVSDPIAQPERLLNKLDTVVSLSKANGASA